MADKKAAGHTAPQAGPVSDGGPWRGLTEAEWVERIAAPSTPAGETIPWIKPASAVADKGNG